MGPPPPATEEKVVVLKAIGGEIGSASSLAPKLGPLGLVSLPRNCHVCCSKSISNLTALYSPPRRSERISRRPPWTGRESKSLSSLALSTVW